MTQPTYSPDEVYHRVLVVTGDAVMANKERQSARRERDAERDALLAWNEAARQFVAELQALACHNCGAAGAASDLIFNSEIENARGQLRPMHYAARAVELEADEEPEPMHYEVYDEGGGQFSLTVGPDEEIAVVKMAHVGHNSGENEWYTPAPNMRSE